MSDSSRDLAQDLARQQVTQNDTDIDSAGLSDQLKRLLAERYANDTQNRQWLARWAVWIVSIWLIVVLFIILANRNFFSLSDAVLIALMGTTTLNVLGLSYIVLKGYFQASEK